jgi:hypothetical protein
MQVVCALLLHIVVDHEEDKFVTRGFCCHNKRKKKEEAQKTTHGEADICLGAQSDLQACAWLMRAAGGRSVVTAGGKGELGDRS